MALSSILPGSWSRDVVILLGGCCLFYYLKIRGSSGKLGLRLPPRPRGWPIIGNAFDIPLKNPGQNYQAWGRKLNSDIVSASALGRVIVVANSLSVAMDLLDKRSASTSSRPGTVMAHELMGWDYLIGTLPYGEKWKERRRVLVQNLRPSDASIVHPQEREFVGRLLLEFNRDPDQFYNTMRGVIGGFIMSLTYGIHIKPQNDPHLELAEFAALHLLAAFTPGAHLVDALPALKYIPSWFPGAGFKRHAASLAYLPEAFRSSPFDEALSYFGTEKARPSFVSTALGAIDESKPDAEHRKQVIKDAAAMFYGAGTDTIVASIMVWIWVMMKNPDVQARVQAELDEVLAGRMPDFEAFDSLPYFTATLMEATRWAPVTPLGIPHASIEDIVYGDYFIPKGSVVMPNYYAMMRNENDWDDPTAYNPDRFLRNGKINPDMKNPFDYTFGFGRRVCPGIHIGRSMLFLATASLATVFKWSEPLDEDGKPINQLQDFETGLLYQPHPFKCEFKVRSGEAQVHLANLESEVM